MEQLELMPDYIESIFSKKGIDKSCIKFIASADLTTDGDFCETWLAVTKSKLIVLTYNSEDQCDDVYNEYLIKDIEEMNAESLVSTGMLTVKMLDNDRVICCYSNTHLRKFGMFAKLFSKVKEGKELTEDDFKDDFARGRCPKCGKYYPDPVRKVCPKCLNKKALFIRVLSFAPKYKWRILLMFILMLAGAFFDVINPYIGNKVFFDQVLTEGGKYYGCIGEIILLMLGTRILVILLGVFQGRINSVVASEIVYDLKCQIFTAMQRLSLSFYNNKQTGNLMNRVNNDATNLQNFFLDGIPYFILNIIRIIGIGVIMFSINWKLAILVLFPTPLIVYFIRKMFPKLFTLFSRRFRKRSAMNSLINDTLTGARVVKAFGKESSEVERFDNVNSEVYKVNVEVANLTSTMFPILRFIMGFGGIIIWGAGSWEVVNGNMTFGTMMTFVGYLGMIYGPLEFMTQIVNWWSDCMNSAQRIFEILDAVPDVAEVPDPVAMSYIKGDITLKNVTFSYEPNKPVLHNIELEIKAGEMIGLVGHSGAGKSTITNLITRLYDVNEGEILIDGINIRDIAFRDLRPQIGMVLQDTYLFTGSIAENIAYAKPEASMEEIIRASKAANAHDFIIKLPDGYDTVIGKRRNNLSGGEKQRISIARAILHNPRILILDEATASVDTETEQQIQQALERLVTGRTTIAIAHRLSTLRNADRLVVVEKGKIAEVGTHEELINKEGIYYKMIQQQKEALKIRGIGDL